VVRSGRNSRKKIKRFVTFLPEIANSSTDEWCPPPSVTELMMYTPDK
jgi:hypothetical protein